MKTILVHGLGQNSKDWDAVRNKLEERGISATAPDLFSLAKCRELSYAALYQAFSEVCGSCEERLNLCGLSLGGLLALNYAMQHTEKVNSLVLIGAPFRIPKGVLKFQNVVFGFMPKTAFRSMGVSKKDFIHLSKSMANLDFMEAAAKALDCPALVLIGAKDKINMESAERYHEAMKNSRLVIVENSGHEVNRDNPDELVRALWEFWAEN